MATQSKKIPTNLQPAITQLHKAFDKFNERFFNNELPQVVITMQSRHKNKGVLGWFTVNPAWESGEDTQLHEINIVPEALKRDYTEILQTLLHEMLHLYASVNGIQDTSRGNTYHNKRFKEIAEQHGMEYTHEKPDSKIGYSAVTFTKQTLNMVKFWNIDKTAFTLSRIDFSGAEKPKKKSNSFKWVCQCEDPITMRTTKLFKKDTIVKDEEGNILAGELLEMACMECGCKFECTNIPEDVEVLEKDAE
jgi:SprT-like family